MGHYTFDWSNVSKPSISVESSTKDSSSTSVSLFGYGYSSWGKDLQQNILHVLENFCSDTPPQHQTEGQVWYDQSSKVLKVWNGSSWSNSSVQAGTTAPANPDAGTIWFNTATSSLSYYDPIAGWKTVAGADQFNSHVSDQSVHLTPTQNTWIDSISVTAGEVNRLSGATANIQYQINTTNAVVSTHANDDAKHLTTAQNTWIDAITATSAEVNYLSGVSSNIQSQIDSKMSIASPSISGDFNANSHSIFNLKNPVNANDAVNKNYVDSIASNLSWKKPADKTTVDIAGENFSVGGTRIIDLTQNKLWESNGSAWVEQPVVDGNALFAKDTETGYVFSGTAWVQFSGAGQLVDGVGLVKVGNRLDVNLGAGIAELPTDGIGVDLYASSGLFLTQDGTNASTASTAQLSIKAADTSISVLSTGIKLSNTGVAAGTYTKLTVDVQGRATLGASLTASDIPSLDWSKITTGKPTTVSGYGITDALTTAGGTMTGSLTINSSTTNAIACYTSASAHAVFGKSSVAGYGGVIGYSADSTKFGILGYQNAYGVYSSGPIYSTGDISAFSDARFKENIVPISDAISKVQQLNGYSYNWKTTGEKSIGVLAQEVQAIFPEIVHETNEGTLSVAYGNLVALLIQAVKELNDEIQTLKAK